jgi:SAM-dependent methyltransferase
VDAGTHWGNVWASRSPDDVSWFEPTPTVSLRRVLDAIRQGARSVIDVGGGASRLIDHLIELDVDRLAVQDVSARALEIAKARLGPRARPVEWILGDVTRVRDVGRFDVWHDRAVFHFLTSPADRSRYVSLCERTVAAGGTAVVATFAPDGPPTCSGLPVCRYDASHLAFECGPRFEILDSERYVHTTPRGVRQPFLYASFARLVDDRELVRT